MSPIEFSLEDGEEIKITDAPHGESHFAFNVDNDAWSIGSISIFTKSETGDHSGLHHASPGNGSMILNLTVDKGGLWINTSGGKASGWYEIEPEPD